MSTMCIDEYGLAKLVRVTKALTLVIFKQAKIKIIFYSHIWNHLWSIFGFLLDEVRTW